MKTNFESSPQWHGDKTTQSGYVNLGYVTHFILATGEIGLAGGVVKKIAPDSRAETGKALEEYDKWSDDG